MTPGWRAVAGTRIGSSHQRIGMPSQDAHSRLVLPEATSVAVADGHGAHPHFRSEHGARIAAGLAARLLAESAAEAPDRDTLLTVIRGGVGPSLVDRWRRDVLTHAGRHGVSAGEPAGFEAADQDAVFRAYGSTVIGLVATPAAVGVLQIGDGDAVVVLADDEVTRALPPDPDLMGPVTTSLCQPDPLRSMRASTIDCEHDEVVLAWAATDGFGAPRTDADGWWRRVGAELARHLRTQGAGWIEDRLSQWLDEPAAVGGDDTTVGLLLNLAHDRAGDSPAGTGAR